MIETSVFIDRSKFTSDSIWNLGSVVILGVSWVLVNFLIARYYAAEVLGIFNQVFVTYTLSSRFATAGVQFSVLKHVAQYSEDREECNRLITAAIICCVIAASLVTVILLLSRLLISRLLDSGGVETGLLYVSVGLWCFAINKLLLAILNGFEMMKAFAFFNSLRGAGLLVGILVSLFLKLDGFKLPIILTIAEVAVLAVLFLYTKRTFSFVSPRQCMAWFKTHVEFGVKSLGTGVVTEVNTHVDILMLGVFLPDRSVGVYSLGAVLIKGIFQVAFVIRRLMDPKLTKLIFQDRLKELQSLIRQGVRRVFWGMLPLYILLTLSMPFALRLFTDNPDFADTWKIILILAAGAVAQSSYAPFGGLMIQGGYPGYQSIFILAVCVTNLVLNLFLIPIFGIYGAAAATAVSYISYALYYKLFVYRIFKIHL